MTSFSIRLPWRSYDWQGGLWKMTLSGRSGDLIATYSPSEALAKWLEKRTGWRLVTPVEFYQRFTDEGYECGWGWKRPDRETAFLLIFDSPKDATAFERKFAIVKHEIWRLPEEVQERAATVVPSRASP